MVAVASVGIFCILTGLISGALTSHVLDTLSGGPWRAESSVANLTRLCHQTSCFALALGHQRTVGQKMGLFLFDLEQRLPKMHLTSPVHDLPPVPTQ